MNSYTNEIYNLFLPVGFGIMILGWIVQTRDIKHDPLQGFRIILVAMCTVALIANFRFILTKTCSMFNFEGRLVHERLLNALEVVTTFKIDSENPYSFASIGNIFVQWLCQGVLWIGSCVAGLAVLVQDVVVQILTAVSPLVLSFFLVPQLSSIAIRFLLTCLAVSLWGIGFNIADIAVLYGWKIMMAKFALSAVPYAGTAANAINEAIIAGGVVSGVKVSAFILIISAFYFVFAICIFYLTGPLLLTLLIKGGDIEGTAIRLATAYGISASGKGGGSGMIPARTGTETSNAKSQPSPQDNGVFSHLPEIAGGGAGGGQKTPKGIDGTPIPGFLSPPPPLRPLDADAGNANAGGLG